MLSIVKNTDDITAIAITVKAFRRLIKARLESYFNDKTYDILEWNDNYNFAADLVIKELPFVANMQEWVVLMLALMPHIQPGFYEGIITEHLSTGGDFAEFGGAKATNHRGMLPTGETAQFLIAANDIQKRLEVQQLFAEEHNFYRHGILWLEPVKEGEPKMSGRIVIANDWIDKLLLQKETAPRFGLDFPARHITTNMLWSDAVLHPQTLQQVDDISNWLQYNQQLQQDENLKRKLKPGYRVLFYGPPGTGKTLTAALLGKQFGKEVYRIDLSQIVSKYIGETEKNLEAVFHKAETKNWILFFDEADALFGKRTNVQSSHDKYANQEVSYLLQRVEDYCGLLILASNFKNNLDDAFIRRFHALIHFPLPNANERLVLWQKSMPASLTAGADVNLQHIATRYELTGAAILNAVQFAALQCLAEQSNTLTNAHIIEGVRREYMKEEKTI